MSENNGHTKNDTQKIADLIILRVTLLYKVSKKAQIRNRYNQALHLITLRINLVSNFIILKSVKKVLSAVQH